MTLNIRIKEFTEQLKQKGLLRARQVSLPAESDMTHFDSNDYLSLTTDKRIATAYQNGYKLYPCGSGASMLLSGYHPNHQAVERAFSELLSVDDCILFSSGYAANLAITALIGRIKAHCLIDKALHASVYDGLALSQVCFTRYHHNDVDDLVLKLNSVPSASVLFTEGIFSMSGQIAPLKLISELCTGKNAGLFVDEAHSFGVIGPQGKGATVHYGLTQAEVPLRVIPLGKAFASQGAVVAGDKEWINGLLQAGRSMIYSTGISPALSYGLLNTLHVVFQADDRRLKLSRLISYFKTLIKSSPLSWGESSTQIQQLQLGCPHLAMFYAQELKRNGISCFPVRSPTVTVKATGLRIILNFNHQEEDINNLFNTLHQIYENTLN
ncbi:aminotransferase class I/II-fold pyridoxal phosphate-dependent enzyme [uncultured Legionella sp.]|uniref:aminotransferase class I/II-fold pyridoxal phosphate-dependent enzyme n=1 Tax=uncultured Legionella sp. TaxID=210934 RepID=UPI0026176C62|nr:aminotransferase class I/II-fold pyridoxal phosphate-dependent enzyme [uncultured Legionella sp.]